MNTPQRHPFFFLHIPRTGGTTVDSIIFDNISSDHILRIYKKNEYEKFKYVENSKLDSIKYITGHLLLDSYDPPIIYDREVLVFTFLRDPIKRLISEYFFYKTWKNNHLYNIINDNSISFSEYITSHNSILKYRGKNFMTRCISGVSFRSGSFPYAALARAKRQLEKNFLFFGLLEYFDESVVLMKHALHLSSIFYEQRNKLAQKIDTTVTDEDISIVTDYNSADISLYDFSKELFLERIDKYGAYFLNEVKQFQQLNNKYKKISSIISDYSNLNKNSDIILPKS